MWAERNLRSGGLIIADNTLLGGGVTANEKPESCSTRQWTEMRKFNEAISDPRRFLSTILPTSEGLTVAIKS
jgi:predicted O-methyltransferase YrrM